MRTLSDGRPSTLGTYHDIAILYYGEESGATRFLADKIKEQGEHQEVLAHEDQMLHILATKHFESTGELMYPRPRKRLTPANGQDDQLITTIHVEDFKNDWSILRIWARGRLAGTLVVDDGDVDTICERLIGGPITTEVMK